MPLSLGSFFWHVVAFGATTLVAAGCAVWTFRDRDRRAADAFLLFLLVVFAWNTVVLARVIGPLAVASGLHPVEQFLQVLTPVAWWYFAVVYTNNGDWLHRLSARAVLGVVVVGMLLVSTVPPIRTLAFTDPMVVTDPFVIVAWSDTVVADVVEVLALGFAAVGSALILYNLLAANYVRVWQVSLVFCSTAAAILFELFESSLPGAVPGVDYPAIAVVGVGVSYLVGLYRYDLFGYTPVDMADVIDSITAPVVVLNPAERVIDFNASAEQLFPGIARGTRMESALPEEVVATISAVESADGDSEVTLTHGDEERVYRLYAAPLDSFGTSDGLAVTFRDVTAQRRQQEQLDLLNQIHRRALRHNIRNEVNIVQANTQALVETLGGERRAQANDAYEAATDLSSMSQKARTLSDVVQRRHELSTVDMSNLVEQVVEEYREQFSDTAFVVSSPQTCRVAVPIGFPEAIENLVENAAEHNDGSSQYVDSTISERSAETVLEVRNNGPGIPPQELATIESREETPLEHGTGVGLWIVQWVADAAVATVEYETGEDGTVATVRFPDAAATE
jgi:signal transduction histidine kinase